MKPRRAFAASRTRPLVGLGANGYWQQHRLLMIVMVIAPLVFIGYEEGHHWRLDDLARDYLEERFIHTPKPAAASSSVVVMGDPRVDDLLQRLADFPQPEGREVGRTLSVARNNSDILIVLYKPTIHPMDSQLVMTLEEKEEFLEGGGRFDPELVEGSLIPIIEFDETLIPNDPKEIPYHLFYAAAHMALHYQQWREHRYPRQGLRPMSQSFSRDELVQWFLSEQEALAQTCGLQKNLPHLSRNAILCQGFALSPRAGTQVFGGFESWLFNGTADPALLRQLGNGFAVEPDGCKTFGLIGATGDDLCE